MYQTKNARAKSYFFNMRNYHNVIKRELYNKYTKNVENVLDLACGKGGDLDKWVSNNIKNVIGYDINSVSINEAKRRVSSYRYPLKTNIKLYVKDLSRDIISGNKNMDVITSMFAFHYFFESKETFDVIMKTIEN
jgi:mRNA (guanine-N7-)-methyltransferase